VRESIECSRAPSFANKSSRPTTAAQATQLKAPGSGLSRLSRGGSSPHINGGEGDGQDPATHPHIVHEDGRDADADPAARKPPLSRRSQFAPEGASPNSTLSNAATGTAEGADGAVRVATEPAARVQLPAAASEITAEA
jgi:hypothetical protein